MVRARWWHRLLLVLFALFGLLLTGISLYVAYEASRETRYFYTWRGDVGSNVVNECRVSLYESIGEASIYCGELDTPAEVFNDLVKYRATGPIQTGAYPEIDYGRALQEAAKTMRLGYAYDRVLVPKVAFKSFGIAALVIFGYMFIGGMAFKLLLWIAHGDTEIDWINRA